MAVTLEQRRGEEALVCYDRDTGHENWVHSYKAHFRESSATARATPTIHAGRVYSLGATGELAFASMAAVARRRWSVDVLNEPAGRSPGA